MALDGADELRDAALANDVSRIKRLISTGISPNLINSFGNTALDCAVKCGNLDAVEALVRAGACAAFINSSQETSLHTAARWNKAEAICLLARARGACVDAEDRFLRTPLQHAAYHGHAEAIQALTTLGAHMDATDDREWTPLMWAAYRGNHAAVAVLLAGGADCTLRVPASSGYSPGSSAEELALSRCHWMVVELLRKAEKEAAAAAAGTPTDQLQQAVEAGQAADIAALVRRGADANAADNTSETLLHKAARRNDGASVEALVKAGADVNASDRHGRTPLMQAALLGRAQALEALLRAGASVDLADNRGRTALHNAAWMQEGRSAACIEALLKAGADVGVADAAGEYALHKAAYHRGFVPALEALLAAGADPAVQVQSLGPKGARGFTCGESAGLTALQLAELRGHTAAAQLLREAQSKAEADEAALKAAFSRPEVQQMLQEKDDEISSLSEQLEDLELKHIELLNTMQLWKGDLSACRGLNTNDLEALLWEQEQHVAELRRRVLERHKEDAAHAAAAEAKEATLCMICLERHRDMFLNCGHLVCSKCAAQLRNCPACRVAVVRTTRAWL